MNASPLDAVTYKALGPISPALDDVGGECRGNM